MDQQVNNKILITSSPIQAPILREIPQGLSLAEIVRYVDGLPARFWDEGIITINGEEVPVEMWHLIRPKFHAHIQLQLAPAGGSKKGGKNVLAILASVLLVAVTVGIGAGLLPVIGIGSAATLGAGTFGAQALAALVGLGGQLLIGALFPPPVPASASNEEQSVINRADIQDNLLSKGQRLPRAVGFFRVAPPLLSQPWSYLVGKDEYAEAEYGMYGPHDITDIRVRNVPIEDVSGVTYNIDRGIPWEPRTTMFTRHGKTYPIQTVMTQHQTMDEDSDFPDEWLRDQSNPEQSLPQYHRMKTHKGPDAWVVRLIFSAMYETDNNEPQITQFRMRIRKTGETVWKNLPQIFYRSRGPQTYRKEITLKFYKLGQTMESIKASGNNRFVGATQSIPLTTPNNNLWLTSPKTGSATYQWEATCGTWRSFNTEEGITIFLDDPYFNDTEATYEVELKRSFMMGKNWFTITWDGAGNPTNRGTDAAILAGTSLIDTASNPPDLWSADFFDAYTDGGWRLIEDQSEHAGSVQIDKATTIYDRPAVSEHMYAAKIQVQVKNIDFTQLSVMAAGLVPQWDGVAWTGLEPTSNPAPHWREMYANTLGMGVDTLPTKWINNDVVIEWMDACTLNGWECNAVLEGTFDEFEKALCYSGYARPVCDTKYGVVFERDTSVETAKQMFTPMNTRDMTFSIAYTKRPIGFRIEFFNKDNDYEKDEIVVFDPYAVEGELTDLETLTYPTKVTKEEARDRALFDFEQSLKAARYSFTRNTCTS